MEPVTGESCFFQVTGAAAPGVPLDAREPPALDGGARPFFARVGQAAAVERAVLRSQVGRDAALASCGPLSTVATIDAWIRCGHGRVRLPPRHDARGCRGHVPRASAGVRRRRRRERHHPPPWPYPLIPCVQAGGVGEWPEPALPHDAGVRALLARPGGRAELARRVRLVGVMHVGENVFAPIVDVLV
jgi:hypothetical protein